MIFAYGFTTTGGCLASIVLAAALLWAQGRHKVPLTLSWYQLISLLAPLRLEILPRIENVARMQANALVLDSIITGVEEWAHIPDHTKILRLRVLSACLDCCLFLLRLAIICGFDGQFVKIGFRLVVHTYFRLTHQLLELHRYRHPIRFRALRVALRN